MCVPADGQGAVDGGSFSLGNGVEWVAVTMANHHLDRQQLVVCRTVTCQEETPISIQMFSSITITLKKTTCKRGFFQ